MDEGIYKVVDSICRGEADRTSVDLPWNGVWWTDRPTPEPSFDEWLDSTSRSMTEMIHASPWADEMRQISNEWADELREESGGQCDPDFGC